MPTGHHRLGLTLLDQAAQGLPDWPSATVTAITTRGGTDGLDLVTVRYAGATLPIAHAKHYTPVLGDVVVLIRCGGNWIAWGSPGGFPPPPSS